MRARSFLRRGRTLSLLVVFGTALVISRSSWRHAAAFQRTPTLAVYDDGLVSGWVNWSWDANVSFAATSPVYSGSRAISFTGTRAWAGLYLHSSRALDLTPYTVVQFAARASQPGQQYGVVLFDTDDHHIGREVRLAGYGGDPVPGAWKLYTIPLADLGVTGKAAGGIAIEDESGSAQPALFIDALAFINDPTGATATVTATAPATASATPVVTPPPSPIAATGGGAGRRAATPAPRATAAVTVTATPSPAGAVSPTPIRRSAATPAPSPSVTATPTPAASPVPAAGSSKYPLHTKITATVFWVGEPQGAGSSENNALSAWDDAWEAHFGGFDDPDPAHRTGFYPSAFTPKENPFYFDLPYNDFTNSGARRGDVSHVPWAGEKQWGAAESMLKNRWIKITKDGRTCYGQWEDSGPYVYDDWAYVFGSDDRRPASTRANNAGMDVSPALRDCLGFAGVNNADNRVDWQFVDAADVPSGPWTAIVTTSQVYWP